MEAIESGRYNGYDYALDRFHMYPPRLLAEIAAADAEIEARYRSNYHKHDPQFIARQRKRAKVYYAENRSKRLAYAKAYRERNSDRIKAKRAERYAADKAKGLTGAATPNKAKGNRQTNSTTTAPRAQAKGARNE